MRVLVLSWDARAAHGGPAPQAAGLATALAAAGHDVRLVTRLVDGEEPPVLDGVEVHAVLDAPPIVPSDLREPLLPVLGFANRATAVAVRRLEERPVDVVHAEGWQTGPVAAALRTSHDVEVVAALDGRGLADWRAPLRATAAALATEARLVLGRTEHTRAAVRVAAGVAARPLPLGADAVDRIPGPPPPRGPVLLVAAPGEGHRATAAALRAALRERRRITASWTRRPFVGVVLDPHDLDAAVHVLRTGVPLVGVPGPVGEVVAATGTGRLVTGGPQAVAEVVDLLADDPTLARTLGAAATAAVAARPWDAVVASWSRAVAGAVQRPRLHTTG